MKDIFFYYRKKSSANRELIEILAEKYPFAKFKLISGSIFKFINEVSKEATTDFAWIFDLETISFENLLSYNIEDWDKSYLHIFESKSTKAYLVPQKVNYDRKANDFPDKKFIKTDLIKSPPFDVFFICYDENNAEKNLRYIKEKRPDVKVISGVTGIFAAHYEAARQAVSEFFWVVDADATVIDAFDFEYYVSEYDFDVVHIWKSYNPINKLEYGHGGVKLIPKHVILNADEYTTVDITTSLTDKIRIVNEISNINNFATSPFNTWRAAFRESAKLASSVISRQNQEETDQRLEAWTTIGEDRPFGEYAIAGAQAGKIFGLSNKNKTEFLAKINDFEWLKLQFTEYNENKFHLLGFYKWKESFEICVKLASRHEDQTDENTIQLLNDLRFNTSSEAFAEYGRAGASAGHWFGSTYKADQEMLEKTNDLEWLRFEYEQHVKMFPPETFKDQEETKSEVNGNTEAITEAQALATS